jgi:hypothetical protein
MSKLAGIIFVILLAAGCAPQLRADTISLFNISGTGFRIGCEPEPFGCTPIPIPEGFAGSLVVDTTTGTPIAMNVLGFQNIFPGIDFNFRPGFVIVGPGENCLVQGSPFQQVLFLCITAPTLVGFDGSTIIGWPNALSGVFETNGQQDLYVLGGRITPSPEPGSFALIAIGFGALLLMRQRMIRQFAV